jgi:hypothetical protein
MNRRRFFRLLSGVPAIGLFQEPKSEPPPAGRGPAHECADRPTLPCPACEKWTGNPFATVDGITETGPVKPSRVKR